ncbi:protein phosphatase PPM1, putative [Plasmodium gallinaceum]|uniref:Protein phosphatase PPM1, putative n=1 Tax=Plasmodium gallinaceum TaxID=5849 RepID=A0A1J1H0E9_PLAGA|nr:protein phosphatase PPM1, putative [Plasmodium gallinaceum]CRG98172.1 protein phosphatase PPM1, putative [Plasmodium gallinaceum]
MNLYDNLKKDSIYIYGKIHELLDHLNNHNFKCYINNEKNVDLSKEFKYQKKKGVEFISILDYYARFKNKESEFLILPIIFNKEYEILYIGVSMLFKENFSVEYKSNCYNYIELFIYNIDKNNVNNYENSITSNNNRSIFKLLINLEDLKISHKEEIIKNNINRIMNNRSNVQGLYFKNNNYYNDNKRKEHSFSQVNHRLKQENYLVNGSNIKYNNDKNFKLRNNDHLIIYNTYNSLKENINLEESFINYSYKIHTNNSNNDNNNININNNNNNNNNTCVYHKYNSNINSGNNTKCNYNISSNNNDINKTSNSNSNSDNNKYNNDDHEYNNSYNTNSYINIINNSNNNNNNLLSNISYSNNSNKRNNIYINDTKNKINNNNLHNNNNRYNNIINNKINSNTNVRNNSNTNNKNDVNNINYDINNNNTYKNSDNYNGDANNNSSNNSYNNDYNNNYDNYNDNNNNYNNNNYINNNDNNNKYKNNNSNNYMNNINCNNNNKNDNNSFKNNSNINNDMNNLNYDISNNNTDNNINISNNNRSNSNYEDDRSNNNKNNFDINNNNNGNIDNISNVYISDKVNYNSLYENHQINKINYYKNNERSNENEKNNISKMSCEDHNIDYQLYYYNETENLVLNIKKDDKIPMNIGNSSNNDNEKKIFTSLKVSESLQHNYMNTKVINNAENDKLSDRVSYIKYKMTYNQNDYIKTNDMNLNNYTEYMKDISIDNVIYKNYTQGNINENERWNNFKSGFYSFKGNRTYNEDRVITIENISDFINNEYNEIIKKKELNESFDKEYFDLIQRLHHIETPSYMYCAIYDGHNGENAVNIIQKFLHLNVYSYLVNGNGISNSLKYGFQSIDEHICKCTMINEEDNHSNLSSGSTACVSIIFKNMLYIANIGDSRCVLSKNGRAIVLTVDHRASINKKEEERIIKSGGVLDDEGYLGGCLGVCRGFGSFDKKTKEKLKGLICEPDLFQIKLTDDDEFLIICCDGVFDVMTSQEAVNTVRASLVQNSNANIASEALCRLAYKRKSLDNLSVVVVIFQNPEMKKKTSINENSSLYSSQTGRVRRRIKFSALKDLINP